MGTFGTSDVGATNGASSANKKQPFWKRNKGTKQNAELGTAGVGAGALIAEEKHRHNNARTSHETGVTGTTAASPGAAYGTPDNRYNNGAAVPHSNYPNSGNELAAPTNTYQPYREGASTGHSHTQVVHDPSPYAEVHHGGYPHTAAPTEYPSTFGHGNYQNV